MGVPKLPKGLKTMMRKATGLLEQHPSEEQVQRPLAVAVAVAAAAVGDDDGGDGDDAQLPLRRSHYYLP